MRFARNMLDTLEARELARTAADISARTGLEHIGAKTGDKIEGVYRRMLTLNSGRFALIERSQEFVLVPWRPVLERAREQLVTRQVGGEGISWSIGVKRGIGARGWISPAAAHFPRGAIRKKVGRLPVSN